MLPDSASLFLRTIIFYRSKRLETRLKKKKNIFPKIIDNCAEIIHTRIRITRFESILDQTNKRFFSFFSNCREHESGETQILMVEVKYINANKRNSPAIRLTLNV